MFCGKCGTKIIEGDNFCTNCGAKVVRPKESSEEEFDFSFDDNEININKDDEEYNKRNIEEKETVFFGTYPQSSASGKTKEPIEWMVLEKKNGLSLLLSTKIIDQVPFFYPIFNDNDFFDENEFLREAEVEEKDSHWEYSFIRKYLNDEFLNNAFSPEEISKINCTNVLSTIYLDRYWHRYKNLDEIKLKYNDCKQHLDKFNNDRKIKYDQTSDKIFILNYEDFIKYFGKETIIDVNKYDDENGKINFVYLNSKNSSGISKITNYVDGDDRISLTIKDALYQKKYDKTKKYNRYIYKDYDNGNACWFLNSIDFSLKLNREEECYRRPVFVGDNGVIQCGNPGCEDGYGIRPAMWVKI